MVYTEVIIKKECRGSEDGIRVKTFFPSDSPQAVEAKLADVFVAQGWATFPVSKPVERQAKIVTVETKEPVIEKKKKDAMESTDTEKLIVQEKQQ